MEAEYITGTLDLNEGDTRLLRIDEDGNLLIAGAVDLPTGAATAAKQPALGTAGTPSADVITTQEPTSNLWNYAAAASGIVNTTTAVTIKAAGAAGVRNFISSIQIMHEVLTNATELAIRDGAAGTVLWRTKIPAGVAGVFDPPFRSPIKGTAATLLEVVTLTASGAGAVYFNAQGFTGA